MRAGSALVALSAPFWALAGQSAGSEDVSDGGTSSDGTRHKKYHGHGRHFFRETMAFDESITVYEHGPIKLIATCTNAQSDFQKPEVTLGWEVSASEEAAEYLAFSEDSEIETVDAGGKFSYERGWFAGEGGTGNVIVSLTTASGYYAGFDGTSTIGLVKTSTSEFMDFRKVASECRNCKERKRRLGSGRGEGEEEDDSEEEDMEADINCFVSGILNLGKANDCD